MIFVEDFTLVDKLSDLDGEIDFDEWFMVVMMI